MSDSEAADRVAEAPRPAFAHASEAELARILDFYQVTWQYEPHVFPILWDLEGNVLESFAPDFYLPELDMYVEMTTLRQRLVRKKNRKLRRLRELYPEIRIKLFYARDFRALMLKYGRVALADLLSGAMGQSLASSRAFDPPTRNAERLPTEPPEVASPPATTPPSPVSAEQAGSSVDAPAAPRGRRSRAHRRAHRLAATEPTAAVTDATRSAT